MFYIVKTNTCFTDVKIYNKIQENVGEISSIRLEFSTIEN